MYPHRQPCNSCQPPMQSPWFQPPAQPVVCPPQYRMHDSFMPRMQPVIHPIVNVNREHIVNVPQHFYTETNQNVVVNPQQQAFPMQQGGFQQPFPQQQQQFFPGQPRF
ncbi:hypothetical protein [Psychrobacillus glaciei]|uniref:hypothetical protein n=1 Tax=Psychrobacillus glaciei TaxID=2283160 RepID=UPI00178C4822|nr:hypothetical protein [Psychrobacillus glaciei]